MGQIQTPLVFTNKLLLNTITVIHLCIAYVQASYPESLYGPQSQRFLLPGPFTEKRPLFKIIIGGHTTHNTPQKIMIQYYFLIK